MATRYRLRLVEDDSWMEDDQDGDYVLYSDYEKLLKDRAELIGALELLHATNQDLDSYNIDAMMYAESVLTRIITSQ